MKNSSIKQKFIEKRAMGMSFAKIASELSVSKPTLIKWSSDLRFEISNYREIDRESLLEKYRLTEICRLEAFGKLYQRILEEIEQRDLSNLPTDKLIVVLTNLADRLPQVSSINLNSEEPFDMVDLTLKQANLNKWSI